MKVICFPSTQQTVDLFNKMSIRTRSNKKTVVSANGSYYAVAFDDNNNLSIVYNSISHTWPLLHSFNNINKSQIPSLMVEGWVFIKDITNMDFWLINVLKAKKFLPFYKNPVINIF